MLLEKEWALEADRFDLCAADAIATESPEQGGESSASSSATEMTTIKEDARGAWEACIDSLLGLVNREASDESEPTRGVIYASLSWIIYLRKLFPNQPPTCIIKEPAGGLLIERRSEFGGKKMINELSLLNDGTAEWTDFVDGKIINIQPIAFHLPSGGK